VSQSITIDQPELITTLTVITPASSNQSNGAIDLTVFGGISPYTYLWSNGATTQDLINVVQGTYTVTITDANLCVYVTSYTVVTTPTSEIVNDLIFNVYPNPTTDKVFIDLNAAELSGSELRVTDMKGRLIMKRIINSVDNTISIDMSDLNGGVYMLKIENSKVSVIRKLVRM
jgi:hypothetical protein